LKLLPKEDHIKPNTTDKLEHLNWVWNEWL